MPSLWKFVAGTLSCMLVVASCAAARGQSTGKTIREADTPALPADESLKKFHTPDDLVIELVAAEPVVRQPVFIDFDERGRMWVVQYLQYPEPAGLKLVSKDKHFRAVYDRVPQPPGHPEHVPGADKITIHEDTNGDGTFDKTKTFVDGLNIVTSFAFGRGGVWVLNPPYLLFYADRDGDDVPDGPPEVHLEGFGLEDTHSVVNSLCWGPDGWLYAAQGSTVSAHVRRPGASTPPVHSHGQLIWRYHPENKQYEIFAEGGGNIWSCVFDAQGRLFAGTNGTPRGYHYVQGGYYHKTFIKHGELSNPYAYGYFGGLDVGGIRLHNTIAIYEGGALPDRYRGTILGCNPLAAIVDVTRLVAAGTTFTAEDKGAFVESDDRWFRPVDVKIGPEGAVYIADWCDQQINHIHNYEGRLDKSYGRIYRVRARQAAPAPGMDLAEKSTSDLVDLLNHESRWYRKTALRLLYDRKDASAIPRLRKTHDNVTGQSALEALWALNASGGFVSPLREKLLRHADPHVQAWTVRLMGDRRAVSNTEAADLVDIARNTKSSIVRSQLAATARRLPAATALPIIAALLTHDEDAEDRFQPLMLWWAVEAKCREAPNSSVAVFTEPSVWQRELVQRHLLERLMRRFASTEKRQDLVYCARLLSLAPDDKSTARLVKGFEEAYRGRAMIGLPAVLNEQLDRIGGGSLVTRLRRRDPQALSAALESLASRANAVDVRKRIIETLGEVAYPEAAGPLISSLDDPDSSIVRAALVALQAYPDDANADAVVKRIDQWPDDVQAVAFSLLSSRASWSLRLAKAVDARQLDKKLVPRQVVVDMHRHQHEDLTRALNKVWQREAPSTKEALHSEISRLTEVISLRDGGNPYLGRKTYLKTCANCHRLYNEGGSVGPDLTGYRRQSLESLLTSIVNPSAEIREGFERHTIFTADGRILTGLLVDQNQNIVMLRPASGQDVVMTRDQIDEMTQEKSSLMPTRLLADLSDQQVRDLIAYLRTGQPLNIKGTPVRSGG